MLQALIDAEATAGDRRRPHERTDTRTTQRNGSRPRLLSTKAGDVELAIPKLRDGQLLPVAAGAAPAHRPGPVGGDHGGLRARRVDPQGRRPGRSALGVDAGISKSEVVADLRASSTATSRRSGPARSDHVEFPYVFLDATYVKARVGGRVVSKAIVVATGVTADGDREVLGVAVGDSEDGAFWTAFLRSLRARGLAGVRLVISDAHEGLQGRHRRGVARRGLAALPGALHAQRPGQGPQGLRRDGRRRRSARSSPSPTPPHVRDQLDRVAAKLGRQFPAVDAMLPDAAEDLLRLRRLPAGPLAQDLVDEPARAGQRGDQAPHQRRGHLPQRRRRRSASSPPSSSRPTTSGPSPNAATSPKNPWPSSTPPDPEHHDRGDAPGHHRLSHTVDVEPLARSRIWPPWPA